MVSALARTPPLLHSNRSSQQSIGNGVKVRGLPNGQTRTAAAVLRSKIARARLAEQVALERLGHLRQLRCPDHIVLDLHDLDAVLTDDHAYVRVGNGLKVLGNEPVQSFGATLR